MPAADASGCAAGSGWTSSGHVPGPCQGVVERAKDGVRARHGAHGESPGVHDDDEPEPDDDRCEPGPVGRPLVQRCRTPCATSSSCAPGTWRRVGWATGAAHERGCATRMSLGHAQMADHGPGWGPIMAPLARFAGCGSARRPRLAGRARGKTVAGRAGPRALYRTRCTGATRPTVFVSNRRVEPIRGRVTACPAVAPPPSRPSPRSMRP